MELTGLTAEQQQIKKARLYAINKETGEKTAIDVKTSAGAVTFSDGETFQQKLENGELKGQTGEKGTDGKAFTIEKSFATVSEMEQATISSGAFAIIDGNENSEDNGKLFIYVDGSYKYIAKIAGPSGEKGEKGDKGDGIKVGITLESATEMELFLELEE